MLTLAFEATRKAHTPNHSPASHEVTAFQAFTPTCFVSTITQTSQRPRQVK